MPCRSNPVPCVLVVRTITICVFHMKLRILVYKKTEMINKEGTDKRGNYYLWCGFENTEGEARRKADELLNRDHAMRYSFLTSFDIRISELIYLLPFFNETASA